MLILITAALAGLQSGATVRLPPGPHPTIEINHQHFNPPVTIDASHAIVNGLRIEGSSGINWRGGTIMAPGGKVGNKPATHGARVRHANNISFDGVTFTNAKHGMIAAHGNGLVVRNSTFTGMRSDGMDVVGYQNVLIEKNRFINTMPIEITGKKGEPGWIDGDHADAIQMWNTEETPRSSDITIRNNVIAGKTQGINTFGPQFEGYKRIIVENNEITTRAPASVSLMYCTDCRIRYNIISSYPGARFPANIRSDESTGLFCENQMLDRPTHRRAAKCGSAEADYVKPRTRKTP